MADIDSFRSPALAQKCDAHARSRFPTPARFPAAFVTRFQRHASSASVAHSNATNAPEDPRQAPHSPATPSPRFAPSAAAGTPIATPQAWSGSSATRAPSKTRRPATCSRPASTSANRATSASTLPADRVSSSPCSLARLPTELTPPTRHLVEVQQDEVGAPGAVVGIENDIGGDCTVDPNPPWAVMCRLHRHTSGSGETTLACVGR